MGYYIISYQVIIDSKLGPSGTQGATPTYEPNAFQNRMKEIFHKKYPDAKHIVIKVINKEEVDKDSYWEAQQKFNP